jgi:hypothetical protein
MKQFDPSELNTSIKQLFAGMEKEGKKITDFLAAFSGALSEIDWSPIINLIEDLTPFVQYLNARSRLQGNRKIRSIFRFETRRKMQRMIMKRFWANYPDNPHNPIKGT